MTGVSSADAVCSRYVPQKSIRLKLIRSSYCSNYGDMDMENLPQHRRASQTRQGSRLRRGSGWNSFIDEDFEDQPTASAERTQEERAYIQSILKTNYLFQDHIHERSLVYLSSAFTKAEYQQGDVIFTQGDTTDKDKDYMLILEKGECAVTIDGVAIPDPYGTIGRGTMVGELALIMESKRRTATVTAKTNVVAFRLDRASFKRFVAGPHETVEDIKAEILKIDQTIDKISGVRTHYGGDIIRKFKPSRAWLWGRWSGTILQQAWKPAFASMVVTCCFVAVVRYFYEPTWELGQIPDADFPLISRLIPLAVLWKYLMNITTFILTFFLAQAYSMWMKMYDTTRTIQGRLNHIVLLVASTVERDEHGKLSEKAEHLVADIGHYVRLFHVFNWASYSKKFEVLSTNRGLSRMLSRGLISRKEYNTLTSLRPSGGPHHTCIMWILVRILSAMKNGTLPNDPAMREKLFDRVCVLVALYESIPDQLDGRIPLSYVHIVQLLVDTFLLIAPFALYTEMGIWSIAATGLLTLFYAGLLVLSKVLLDPLDNDEYYAETVNMDIGVLIRETNNASVRWKYNAEILPFSSKEC